MSLQMKHPKKDDDKLSRWVVKACNEIEINLALEGVNWSDPESRSAIIAAVIATWETIKSQDKE